MAELEDEIGESEKYNNDDSANGDKIRLLITSEWDEGIASAGIVFDFAAAIGFGI